MYCHPTENVNPIATFLRPAEPSSIQVFFGGVMLTEPSPQLHLDLLVGEQKSGLPSSFS